MPRAKAILQSEFPYNITSRCINREWFNLPMPVVWEIFCEELNRAIKEYHLLVHNFILMSNHYHLLASTPEANVSQCLQQFNHRSSIRLTKEGNRINQTFAGRHFKCIVQDEFYFRCVYKYNYRNPVKANICEKVEDYPYSTLQGLLGIVPVKIPVIDPIFENPIETLKWLNAKPDDDKLEAVRFGLKRQFFEPKRQRNNGRPIISIEDDF